MRVSPLLPVLVVCACTREERGSKAGQNGRNGSARRPDLAAGVVNAGAGCPRRDSDSRVPMAGLLQRSQGAETRSGVASTPFSRRESNLDSGDDRTDSLSRGAALVKPELCLCLSVAEQIASRESIGSQQGCRRRRSGRVQQVRLLPPLL